MIRDPVFGAGYTARRIDLGEDAVRDDPEKADGPAVGTTEPADPAVGTPGPAVITSKLGTSVRRSALASSSGLTMKVETPKSFVRLNIWWTRGRRRSQSSSSTFLPV